MAKRKLASWWKLVFVIILTLAALNFITYSAGGSGVRIKGAQSSIDRSADEQFFKINDQYAFSYSPKYQAIDLIRYQPASGLNSLFGDYERAESLFLQPSKNGDWIYNATPAFIEPGKVIAVNIKTNEQIVKEEPPVEDPQFFPSNLHAQSLTQDSSKTIREADLLNLEELKVPKESAITLFLGIMAMLVFWLLLLPFSFKKTDTNQ